MIRRIASRALPDFCGLERRFAATQLRTEALLEGLSAEDLVVQSMQDASPAKWHLAHTAWFFERLVLVAFLPSYRPFSAIYMELFNSYYRSLGARYARGERGLLTRPSLDEVYRYREHVRTCMDDLFEIVARMSDSDRIALHDTIELGINHEQQHQELIITDLKHLFSRNPLEPILPVARRRRIRVVSDEPRWYRISGGVISLGAEDGFSFDNERPRHPVIVPKSLLRSHLVTNADYLGFMEDGGYDREEFWLAAGWDAVLQTRWRAPAYWFRHKREWYAYTLTGARPVDLDEPVCHVSYYEADAYARYAQARLPTEAEWECASTAYAPGTGAFAEDQVFHPYPVGGVHSSPACCFTQMLGNVWEWTRSEYDPYPGYVPPPGPLGEYNGKFMSGQYVLRGGSCATPREHIRTTYRNFLPPLARWQFSGIRLAQDE